MTITFMQSSALVILLLVLVVMVVALVLALLYLVVRAAVRSGIDHSDLAAFLRQIKLAELQSRYEGRSDSPQQEKQP